MEYSFKAEVVLVIEHKEGEQKSKHVATDFNLEVSNNLDVTKYIDHEDLPTQDGSKALSNVLVQGLIGNIHMAHENGFRDSAEHLRWIISELEKGFVAVVNVEKKYFND